MGSLDKTQSVNISGGSVSVAGTVAVPNGSYYDPAGNILTINSAAINYAVASAGDQSPAVVAAVVGKKIRVLAMALTSSINGPTCFLRSGTGGTQISETILRNITGSTSAMNYQRSAYYPIFLYETAAGQALVLNASATGTCSVQVVYVLI